MTAIKLADLEPEFIRHEERDGRVYSRHVTTVAEAHGVQFLCPACFEKNGGPVGTHLVWVTFRDRAVADHLGSQSSKGGPSRWTVSGDALESLTLQPSIDCGCWHGYVTNGVAQ
jgi:hypothetical protein